MGLRGYGATQAQAFEQVALALTATVTDLHRVRSSQCVTIECEGEDRELLLVDWLNALVFEMATRRMLFSRFEVRFVDRRLLGKAWGEAINRERHSPAVEVKGATYTALKVAQLANGEWLAQCVIDV